MISYEHPYFSAQDKLIEKYGSYEDIPENKMPKLSNIKVMVKSTNYGTVGSIPAEVDHKDKFTGLIVSSINSIDDEEASLLKQSFPGLNVSNLIIIEQGRKPSSMMISMLMMAGGVLIIVGGGAWGLKSLKS